MNNELLDDLTEAEKIISGLIKAGQDAADELGIPYTQITTDYYDKPFSSMVAFRDHLRCRISCMVHSVETDYEKS